MLAAAGYLGIVANQTSDRLMLISFQWLSVGMDPWRESLLNHFELSLYGLV